MNSILQRIKHSIPGARTNGFFYRQVVAVAAWTRDRLSELHVWWMRRRYRLPEMDIEDLLPEGVTVAEPILDHGCMPPNDITHKHDDFGPLMKLAKSLQCKVIVELGTAYGNTTANLALNCPLAHIYTVNAPAEEMTGEFTTYSLDTSTIGVVYRDSGFENRVTQICADTLELNLAEHLGDQKIDLAVIDACHDAPYVENDFFKVLPYMSESGVILLHDTHPSMKEHLFGSYMAALRLRRAGYDIRQLRMCWWGVYSGNWDAVTGVKSTTASTEVLQDSKGVPVK
jgi:predicted O-methyltransferase YrrM